MQSAFSFESWSLFIAFNIIFYKKQLPLTSEKYVVLTL